MLSTGLPTHQFTCGADLTQPLCSGMYAIREEKLHCFAGLSQACMQPLKPTFHTLCFSDSNNFTFTLSAVELALSMHHLVIHVWVVVTLSSMLKWIVRPDTKRT